MDSKKKVVQASKFQMQGDLLTMDEILKLELLVASCKCSIASLSEFFLNFFLLSQLFSFLLNLKLLRSSIKLIYSSCRVEIRKLMSSKHLLISEIFAKFCA
jgi:hypothetical protein